MMDDEKYLNDEEYSVPVKTLQKILASLKDAYEQLARDPMQRAAYIIARAANIDEDVVREALEALARGDYSARASALIAAFIDEVERYRAGYLDSGDK
jgi:ABC-type nitrate/sulfonate/bicarbonate transport system substrate-binding protein